jgi:hypothetical protein
MITKNLPITQALWKVPFRISLNKIFALKALLAGDGKTFIAVFKAHLHYLDWLFFKRKKGISVTNKNTKLYGSYKGLVIWQYFINKKRTFSEIIETKKDF